METPDKQGNSKPLPPQCWRPGQSGNPKGRTRKDLTLTTLLKEELEKVAPGDKQGRTWLWCACGDSLETWQEVRRRKCVVCQAAAHGG